MNNNLNLLNNAKKTFKKLKEVYTKKEIAIGLNVSIGTIQRWEKLNKIPSQYIFDIMRLLSLPIDYNLYTEVQKDQFFTPDLLASECYSIFCKITNINIKDYIFIEPSAGDGSFVKYIPKNSICLDVEPRHKQITQQDYLEWNPMENNKYVVIGNPPFGLRGHVALKFINHSYKFADYIGFILPQLFESDGKGSPRKRVIGYNLIYSKLISGIFNTPSNKNINISGVFQIWSKYETNEKLNIKDIKNDKIKVYSLSDGGTIATTRNKKMLHLCDVYLPSTCFNKQDMKLYYKFNDLPHERGYGIVFLKNKKSMLNECKKIPWSSISFKSTNSSYNLRTSLIIKALL